MIQAWVPVAERQLQYAKRPYSTVIYFIFISSNKRNVLSDQRMLRNIRINLPELDSEPTNLDLVVCTTSSADLAIFRS